MAVLASRGSLLAGMMLGAPGPLTVPAPAIDGSDGPPPLPPIILGLPKPARATVTISLDVQLDVTVAVTGDDEEALIAALL